MLVTSIGNFGQKGFYNAQEIGLAKELDKLFEEVIVYKAVPATEKKSRDLIDGCEHSALYQIPVRSRGINGEWDCSAMDATLDALLYFSDTQLAVPKVYRWCCRHKIGMYPYIGVVESHSTSRLKKLVINALFQRNLRIYRKCACFVKTPAVADQLRKLKIKRTVVAPVGLDSTLLNDHFQDASVPELKKKYGYSEKDRVVLFIGRMIEEKQPVRMIEILAEIRKRNPAYKLLMVGNGEMKPAVLEKVEELNLAGAVQMIERIPNQTVWELYRISDAFINLNQQEIFGMAILEAMYYGCKVVAWKAPGPDFVIENGKSGWLAQSNKEVMDEILDATDIGLEARQRVLREFTWK